jgi:hypothetical protein
MRIWLLAGLSGITAAAQVPSEELNKQIPSRLRFSAEYRARFEGFDGGGFRDGNDDVYLLNRVRVGLKIQPATWLKFVFQGQDARALGNSRIANAPPYQNSMDLRIGYVELGDPESKPASLRLGRQEINFGDQRLVGSSNWSNVARTFDAVRATFRHAGYRLDAFAASVVVLQEGAFDRPAAGNNLHGLYGGMEKLVPQATIEPYILWRLQPRLANEHGAVANLDFKTIGVRWVGKIPGGFDYATEVAGQTGGLGADTVRAWAGHWVFGYTIPKQKYQPRFSSEYNHASGDKNPRDGIRGTFDHLYPTPHSKYGLCDQVGWRNIHDLRHGFDFKPHPKLSLAADFHSWWLDSATDALYSASGTVLARRTDGSAGTHIGEEIDIQSVWTVSKQVQIGAGLGHIFPGEFLKKASPGHSYTYPFLMLNVGL